MDERYLLRVLVGSRAHGTATPKSDWDYKGVYVVPTAKLLQVGRDGMPPKARQTMSDKHDNVDFELGKFLLLATKSNPTILEMFGSPRADDTNLYKYLCQNGSDTGLGTELRELFPYVWSSKGVHDAFIGYGLHQQKKMLTSQDKRSTKHAISYLRTLYQGTTLLKTGDLPIGILSTEVGPQIQRWKSLEFPPYGEVLDTCIEWKEKLDSAYEENPDKKANLGPINEFLLKIRRLYWNEQGEY